MERSQMYIIGLRLWWNSCTIFYIKWVDSLGFYSRVLSLFGSVFLRYSSEHYRNRKEIITLILLIKLFFNFINDKSNDETMDKPPFMGIFYPNGLYACYGSL